LISSQLLIENWHEHIGHPTIADASLTSRKKLKVEEKVGLLFFPLIGF
jgi:hypothetical protein